MCLGIPRTHVQYPTQHCFAYQTRTVFTVRYKKSIRLTLTSAAVPWFRRLVVGLSQRRPGFDPVSVHVRFVVESGNGTGIFWVVWLALSPSFHQCPTLSFIYMLLLPIRSNWRGMWTFQKTIHRLSLSRVSMSQLSASILNPCS